MLLHKINIFFSISGKGIDSPAKASAEWSSVQGTSTHRYVYRLVAQLGSIYCMFIYINRTTITNKAKINIVKMFFPYGNFLKVVCKNAYSNIVFIQAI